MSDELKKLITRGGGIINEPYGSPRFKLWQTKTYTFVQKNYDPGIFYAFDSCFSKTIAFDPYDTDAYHHQDMKKAIQFLEELQDEPIEEQKPEPRPEQRPYRSHQQPINITVNASPTNTNTVEVNIDDSVKVQHIVERLIEEVEKMPDSVEKKGMVQKLKDLTTNPTFAQITGTALAEFLKRIGQ